MGIMVVTTSLGICEDEMNKGINKVLKLLPGIVVRTIHCVVLVVIIYSSLRTGDHVSFIFVLD